MSGQKTNTGSGIFDWQFERPDRRYGYNADTQWGAGSFFRHGEVYIQLRGRLLCGRR